MDVHETRGLYRSERRTDGSKEWQHGTAKWNDKPAKIPDHVVNRLISRAIAFDGPVEIIKAAGLDKPDISIFSTNFSPKSRDCRRKTSLSNCCEN
ncbi:MAG: DUF3387 domain-containing protein [Methanofollis sp.]|nr:DUF3387 domain-containing protein [Methanofollis sp.]